MKITLCGSIAFYSDMLAVKEKLEKMGYEVDLPPSRIKDNNGNIISVKEYYQIRQTAKEDENWVWERKAEVMTEHFNKVAGSDAILVLNYDKHNVKGYVGNNTFLEMGVAFFLKKKIYLLNKIPELSSKEEILALKPIVINDDLSKIFNDYEKK